MTSDDRYIFSTIIEVDSKLRIIYIESFTGEKAVAVKFTDNDYFDRLLRYNVNYHGDKVVTYIPSGRWGLLASDCQAVNRYQCHGKPGIQGKMIYSGLFITPFAKMRRTVQDLKRWFTLTAPSDFLYVRGLHRTMSEHPSRLTRALEDTIRAIRPAKDPTLNKLVTHSHAAFERVDGQLRD